MARQTLTVQLMHAQARIAELEGQVAELQRTKRPAAQVDAPKPQPREFDRYWDYVRAAKAWCNAARVSIRYASQEQFDDQHAAA